MVEESKSSNRTLIIILAVVALVLAVGAGIVAAAVVLSDDSGEAAESAQAAAMMPEDTSMFMSLNPHLDQAENYEVIENAWGDNPLIKMGLAEMLGSMEKDGFSYEDDIQPWLGDEMSFGMMGDLSELMLQGTEMSFSGIPDEPAQMGEMPAIPQFVIAVATTDPTASTAFMEQLRAKSVEEGVIWQDTDYQGVQIAHSEAVSLDEPPVAYATVGDFLVVAVGGLEPMQAVIDTQAQDGRNLADDNQSYKDVMEKLPAGEIGYGYFDIGAFMDAFLEAAESELADMAPGLLDAEQYQAFKGAGFSAGLEPNGLRVNFVTLYTPDALPEDMAGTEAISEETVKRAPASTLVFFAGNGLGAQIQQVLDAVKAMPDQPEDLDEQLQMMTGLLGVSMDELIEMLSGDFAVAVAPDPAGLGGDPEIPIGASFVVKAADEAQFQKLINSVSALASLGGEMELGETTVNGVKVVTIPGQTSEDVFGGAGVGEGYFAIGTSEELLEAAFDGDVARLDSDAIYQDAVAPLPGERSSLFYMNLDSLLALVEDSLDPMEQESFSQANPLLEPVKAISAAAEPLDRSKGWMSGMFFVLIDSE
jgi:hypothetical protein